MKKLLALSALAALFTVTVNAQSAESAIKKEVSNLKQEKSAIKKEEKEKRKELKHLKGAAVSAQSKEAFYSDFGNIPGTKWERTKHFDEATFTKDGLSMKAFYDVDSKLVGTTTKKTFQDIPMSAQNEIKKLYKQYSIGEVILFDDNEANDTDMMLFGSQLDDENNYFVDLKKDNKELIVKVDMNGVVSFYKQLK